MTTENAAARLTEDEREVIGIKIAQSGADGAILYVERLIAQREAAAFAGFMRALLAARVVCPVHGIPDCGPLLNGCSIPRHIAEWRGEFMDGLRAALAP